MIHVYPYFFMGSVELEHYNIMVDSARSEGLALEKQNFGYGFGLGAGYTYGILEVGTSLGMFISSQTSDGTFLFVYYNFKHSLYNYLIQLHAGLSYRLGEFFSIYTGIKPMFGLSNLKFNIRVDGPEDFGNPYSLDASLNSTSFGIGFEARGGIKLSRSFSAFVGIGYDMIEFKRYKGKVVEKDNDTTKTYTAYLAYNPDDLLHLTEDKPEDNEWGVEDLNGFRFYVGLRFSIGGF